MWERYVIQFRAMHTTTWLHWNSCHGLIQAMSFYNQTKQWDTYESRLIRSLRVGYCVVKQDGR